MTVRPRALFVLLAVSGGLVALLVAATGSLVASVATGVLVLATTLVVARNRALGEDVPDPSRRRLLAGAGGAGLALVATGSTVGAAVRRRWRPNPLPRLEADATDLGAGYLELIVRAYHPERSGDLQLVVTPFSSSNYEEESQNLVPNDPRSSHAVVWMYGERVPIVVWSPGRVEPQNHDGRVTLADLAPTAATLMGFDAFDPADGVSLPGIEPSSEPPRVIVTFVIDGGGWNVLQKWPDAWPNLRRLMGEGATYRNALTGSFPAVTAAAHATIGTGAFPRAHGITGHNVRRGGGPVKAWGDPGHVDPSFLLQPTLADRWTEHTRNQAWVGELGYQVWHLGMLGRGGRPRGELPVGVFWHENGGGGWQPHNPDLYRLPRTVPGRERLESLTAAYGQPPPSPFDPQGKKAMCCFPPIVRYQGELIESTFDSEPIGDDDVTDLLYVNFKAPDYAGHVYNFEDPHQADVLRAVDQEIGLLGELLEARFGDSFVLIVTADHGQCPQIDPSGGVRIDPIQLEDDLRREFGTTVFRLVDLVAPSEVYLDGTALFDAGVSKEEVASFLSKYRYGQNIGPYIPRPAVRRDRLDARTFAAVLPTSFIAELASRDLSRFGETSYPDADPLGLPQVTW